MGLDNYITYKGSDRIPLDIFDKFVELNLGIAVRYETYGTISFRGNLYNDLVQPIINKSLWSNFSENNVKNAYERLFNNNSEEHTGLDNYYEILKEIMNLNIKVGNINDEMIDKFRVLNENLFDAYEDFYKEKQYLKDKMSKDRFDTIKEIFRLCSENGLGIYANF